MTPARLDRAGRLLAFNWLVADTAHADWLDGSAAPCPRWRRRQSSHLLERHDLTRRFLRGDDDRLDWLLLPAPQRLVLAGRLGTAMLGGWVRNSLRRAQVAQQRRVLGDDGRAAALRHADTLRALPYCGTGRGWPLARPEPSAVVDLGLACLLALLIDPSDGCRERFLLQFSRGRLAELSLSSAQRAEAQALIRSEGMTP